jgi:hypothetical protein
MFGVPMRDPAADLCFSRDKTGAKNGERQAVPACRLHAPSPYPADQWLTDPWPEAEVLAPVVTAPLTAEV